MTTSFQLSDEVLRPIVAKAILEEISPEQRSLMVQAALEHLMEREVVKGQYGARDHEMPSVIEQSMRDGVVRVARQVVGELLESEEFEPRVRAAVAEGLRKAIEERGPWLFSAIGEAVGERVAKALTEAVPY